MKHSFVTTRGEDNCDHKFVPDRIVTWASEFLIPGTGARNRYYARSFYCEKCMRTVLSDVTQKGDTYSPILYDAFEIDNPKEI